MQRPLRHPLLALALLAIGVTSAFGQAIPTTQPKLLQIFREQIKTGHAAAHVKTEAGWPAAYAKSKSPDNYIALSSMTGPQVVWFLSPWDSYTAWGKSSERDDASAELTAELERLSLADAAHADALPTLEAMARPDLSHGAYPDIAKQRFWEITVMRVKPGHDGDFATAAKTYKAVATRAMPNARWRVYQITAGMPGSTYLLLSTVESFGQFDAMFAEGMAGEKAMTPAELDVFKKFDTDALMSQETNRFRLDPDMSYVSAETKATDPAFWSKKK
ncbi:MAG: hypothetical protein NTY02_15610 [Acidobacteria bacterium]|nr:hypothetical protein [Acidobacteriota bacterium]